MKKTIHFVILLLLCVPTQAQKLLETGGKEMPNEWIDKDTGHKVLKLTRNDRNNQSFYFHNNPFVGNKMLYYSTEKGGKDRQLYILDLNTLQSERLTNHPTGITEEIVSVPRNEAFYQVGDSIFAVNISSKQERLVYVFPSDFKGDVKTINADGSLLGGFKASDEEKEISKKNPEKHDYFNKIYEAKLPRTLFTINIDTKELTKVFTDSAWLNHVQFSPTNPALLMFCHEGSWHKVNRIWTIDINIKQVTLIHHRSMDMEIAGHEWFGADGRNIWFDLQQPRGETFFVCGTDLITNTEKKYALQRNEWSVHYTSNRDNTLFAGDGGDSTSVAKAKNGKWIYLFTPNGDKFTSERLVNMQNHKYKLEPNVHFSPDGKWIIFRANFEGKENVYAVEVKKS